MRYPFAYFALVSLALGVCQVSGAEYPCRWVYVSKGLHKDQDVAGVREIVKTAGEHGLNGMVLTGGLERLDRQSAEYFKRLEAVKRTCAEHHIEIVPILYSAGYGGSVLGEDRNLAEGLPVKDARFVVTGQEARLKTDFPVEIPNGGFEDHAGDRARGWPRNCDLGSSRHQSREDRKDAEVARRTLQERPGRPHGRGGGQGLLSIRGPQRSSGLLWRSLHFASAWGGAGLIAGHRKQNDIESSTFGRLKIRPALVGVAKAA